MSGGMSYKSGRDMPPGMQEKMAVQIAQKLSAETEQRMEFICGHCGKPTNNSHDYGTFALHTCDDCLDKIQREVLWQRQGETLRGKQVVCPYCGYELDGYGSYQFEVGETQEHECENCSRKFDVEVTEVRYYTVMRSACEMPPDWQPSEEQIR